MTKRKAKKPDLRVVVSAGDTGALTNDELDAMVIDRDQRAAVTDNDPDLLQMNERHAVVKVGGKTRVVSFDEDGRGQRVMVFSTINDFVAFHAKHRKEYADHNGTNKRAGIGKWWIQHEGRRQYAGIVYAPGVDVGDRLNLWQGFACKPASGDCDLYLKHINDVICAGDKIHADYLLRWMATAVQSPGTAGEVAVVLRGREGTGKGVFARMLGSLYGVHFIHVTHGSHLTGHFNAHLQHCSVLFADEAFFAGDRQHESVLKALITEDTILIEPKGLDPYSVRNCVHLIMASNSQWVVPAGADARRYFVLDVSDSQIQNSDYFAAITYQMEHGGREALLHHLLNMDLAEFNVRQVPSTHALADQKTRSRRGVDRLIEMIAHDGVLPSAHVSKLDVAVTSGEEKGEGFYYQARKLVPELKHESSIIIARTLRHEWGCQNWKSAHQRGLEFPSLADLRHLFDRKHGAQDWDHFDAVWGV